MSAAACCVPQGLCTNASPNGASLDSDGVIGIGLQDAFTGISTSSVNARDTHFQYQCERAAAGDVGAGSTGNALEYGGKLVGRQAWILVQNSAAMKTRTDQNSDALPDAASGNGWTEEKRTHCTPCKNDVAEAYRCPAGRELAPSPLVANRARLRPSVATWTILQKMTLITSNCVATRSLRIKWP